MKKSLSVLALLTAIMAHANDIQVGVPAYGGTGCPSGSASLEISPDGKTLKLRISQVKAEAGMESGKYLDIKSCNIAVPVHVPQGMSVSITPVTFKGHVSLPARGQAKLSSEFFFAGHRGPVHQTSFAGPIDQDFELETARPQLWSACGADTNIRMNISIEARTNSSYETATMILDDQSEFTIETKSCN